MSLEHITSTMSLDALEKHMESLAEDHGGTDPVAKAAAGKVLFRLSAIGRTSRDILNKAYRVDAPANPTDRKDQQDREAAIEAARAAKGRIS